MIEPLKQHCAIMQPTFLPWSGFFALIASSEHFYFLDDVQLAKQSWQTRNQILVGGKATWLSVPVFHKNLNQLIKDTEIDDRTRWRDKQIKTIQMNYSKAPYIKELDYIFEIMSDKNIRTLCDLNMNVIRETSKKLGLTTQFHVSSNQKHKSNDRSQRLIDLCKAVDCNTYISPTGAKEYLMEDGFTDQNDIPVKIFSFTPAPYSQIGKSNEFISHLSFVDVVANLSMNGFRDYALDSKAVKLESLK